MWRVADLVECLIFLALALMLGYTVFVTVRFFRRYYVLRRESRIVGPGITWGSERREKNRVVELSRGIATLKWIAAAAPFLGLAGMSYGILALFSRPFLGLRLATIPLELSTALTATAAGLLVATSAAVCHNILRTRLEEFEIHHSSTLLEATPRSYGFAQTLPLPRQFSAFPAFALIGAPVLGLLIPMLILSQSSQTSVGLLVHASKIDVSDHDSTPIVVSVIGESATRLPVVYVNSKETPWDELGNTLRIQLEVRPHWVVYVTGGDKVPWEDVARAIDVARGLHAEVVLLTAAPNTESEEPHERRKIKQRTN